MALYVSGRLEFELQDAFTDPVSIRELIEDWGLDELTDYQGDIPLSKPYAIVHRWSGTLSGLVMKDRGASAYLDDDNN